MNAPRNQPRPHPTFSPALNVALILAYIALAAALMALCKPPVPVLFPIIGVILGGVGGFLQHLGLKRDYNRFGAASSMVEIRRRLTQTRAGKGYIFYFWAVTLGLVVLTFAVNQSPITAVAAFAVSYLSFAAARETITLRDARAMTQGRG
jgi:hypothetical protein